MSTIAKRPRLSVAVYDRMVEHGILPETNCLELINGRIVEKEMKDPAHRIASRRDALYEPSSACCLPVGT